MPGYLTIHCNRSTFACNVLTYSYTLQFGGSLKKQKQARWCNLLVICFESDICEQVLEWRVRLSGSADLLTYQLISRLTD
mmetsp:Transcript_66417/g.110431  ORF Transcript_66417/g.110431 Transcript_66417/m.110431 type:complete len:80 (+) Transcript_66417:292-531(+)